MPYARVVCATWRVPLAMSPPVDDIAQWLLTTEHTTLRDLTHRLMAKLRDSGIPLSVAALEEALVCTAASVHQEEVADLLVSDVGV